MDQIWQGVVASDPQACPPTRIHRPTFASEHPFAEWGEVFPNAACVVSLIDRLMHRAEVVRIEGQSYRQKEADEREAARKVERAARKTALRSRKTAA